MLFFGFCCSLVLLVPLPVGPLLLLSLNTSKGKIMSVKRYEKLSRRAARHKKKSEGKARAFSVLQRQYRMESAALQKNWEETASGLSECPKCEKKTAALSSQCDVVGNRLAWAIRVFCPICNHGTASALNLYAALFDWDSMAYRAALKKNPAPAQAPAVPEAVSV